MAITITYLKTGYMDKTSPVGTHGYKHCTSLCKLILGRQERKMPLFCFWVIIL